MTKIKTYSIILISAFFFRCEAQISKNESHNFNVSIPTAGNSWVINDISETPSLISSAGISNWSDPNHTIRTFFYVEKPCTIQLGIRARIKSGSSKINISLNGVTEKIHFSDTEYQSIYVGEFLIAEKGYFYVDLQGVKKDNNTYGEVIDILLGTNSETENIKFISDDFYFGRRGPSTHLLFDTPANVKDIAWFYNEIEIAESQDAIGSYFMANGFKGGYFGIQVNSASERRILFSIWSPYKTDNPESVPEEFRISLLKKGKDVNTGKFGNEGSGGQSYKVYDWKTKTRYRFLIGAEPTGNGATDFAAYFYDPVIGKWELIASFRRPKTDTYLTGLYSFLENFIPNTGVVSRKGGFYNQWVYDTKGNWNEITKVKFSADQTAKKGARLDYSGGIENNGFFLKNCGFTNDLTPIGTEFTRSKSNSNPTVDFNLLD